MMRWNVIEEAENSRKTNGPSFSPTKGRAAEEAESRSAATPPSDMRVKVVLNKPGYVPSVPRFLPQMQKAESHRFEWVNQLSESEKKNELESDRTPYPATTGS